MDAVIIREMWLLLDRGVAADAEQVIVSWIDGVVYISIISFRGNFFIKHHGGRGAGI